MEAAKKLVINIVTWNSARYLPSLFESIDAQTSEDLTVTVVDNASADGTQEWIEERPDVMMLRNFRNQGFARAHNQGIALALSRWQGELDLDRRYVCLLNPDTVLDSRCMERVIAFMDAHPDVMIAGPKLLRAVRVTDEEGDEVSIERSNVIDSAGITIRKSRVALDRGAGEEDRGQYDHDEPFGISGATMVIRASAIPLLRMGEEGEVFDEDFFAYKEDADLSWRARLLGMRITLIPEARIWHHRSAKRPDEPGVGSTVRAQRARSPLVNKYSHRNQIWMEWKNDDTVNRLLHLPWRIPQLILRCGACLLLPQHLKAVIEAWMGRSRMAAKRKELMARRKVDAADMRKWFV